MQKTIAFAGGVLVLGGLWTPAAAILIALNELSMARSATSPYIHGLLAIISVSIAMLGPGASSVDARLFGRTRFDIDRKRGKSIVP